MFVGSLLLYLSPSLPIVVSILYLFLSMLDTTVLHQFVCVLVAQFCLSLCNPMDYSLPDSSIHGISQAIIVEWVAISFSRGSSWPRIEPGSPALLADSLPSEPPGYLPISSIYIIWNFQLLLISILHLTLRLWIKIKTVEDEKICFQQMTIHKETLKIHSLHYSKHFFTFISL